MEFRHKPVMLESCMNGLNLKNGGVYFDGTLGGGGHSEEILKRTAPDGVLIATDKDDDALIAARERLNKFGGRFISVKSDFKKFDEVLDNLGYGFIDGVLLDLGVSSYQLDNRERGFSYMADDSALDMRMDRSSPFSAYDVVNGYDEKKLKYVLETYGEEKFAAVIARNIVKARQDKPLKTTGELVKIIDDSIPKKFNKDGHPAKRSFQAIRIEVNEELGGLDEAIRSMINRLDKGGRIAIITFHSLEDRIVKTVFRDMSSGCICDKRYPCVCGRKEIIKEINKKPITASESEKSGNPRSKCAKLRIAEKL